MSAGEVPTVKLDPLTRNLAHEEPENMSSSATVPSRTPASIGRWLGATQSEVQSRLRLAYWRSRQVVASTVEKIRHQAQSIREVRPIPALAVISGSAFALGVTLAVLKPRRK